MKKEEQLPKFLKSEHDKENYAGLYITRGCGIGLDGIENWDWCIEYRDSYIGTRSYQMRRGKTIQEAIENMLAYVKERKLKEPI